MEKRSIIDLHVHCGPEAIPRKYDFLELDKLFEKSGVKAAVAKSHFHSTAPWAYMSAKHGNGNLFGSIVLNHYVGGINPHAVLASLGLEFEGKSCLKVVWMPTSHAKGHYDMQITHGQEYDIPAEWTGGIPSIGRQKLKDIRPISIIEKENWEKTLSILEIIAKNNLILATGHLTKEEVLTLVPEAVEMGVSNIILTHPVYEATGLTIEEIIDLTKLKGVYAEQSYGLVLIDDLPISVIVEQIRKVGAGRTILTSDLGQKQSPDPPDGMITYMNLLTEYGVSEEEIRQMTENNPAKLLGI